MDVRIVTPSDLEELQRIGKQTFQETFEAENSENDMCDYLENGFSLEKLKTEISDSNTMFYFATDEDKVIGYLKLNTGESQTELKDPKGIEIERIYVVKEYQGKHAGQMLYSKAIEVAHAKQAEYVWLGVWEKNPRAISFYNKNGFITFDKHIFRLGNDEQTDIMMKLQLNAQHT